MMLSLLLLGSVAQADWVNEMRLTLANYALSKATSPPDGFKCSQAGTKHNSCHCWGFDGKPSSQQEEDYCHMPPECLAYDISDEGDFKFDSIGETDSLDDKLSSWGVPSDMYSSFHTAVLVESATFVAFDLKVTAGEKGEYQAHVGTARKYNGSIQLGWTYGASTADLVQPYIRSHSECPPGSCHGTTKGMEERGYTDEEIARLNDGLASYSFKQAAAKAQPNLPFAEIDFLRAAGKNVTVTRIGPAPQETNKTLVSQAFELLMEAIQLFAWW